MFVLRIIIVVSFGMLSVTPSNSRQAERFLCRDSACTDSAKGLYPGESVENQKNDEYIKQTNYSELYFIVAAVVTLLFTFIYYKHQRETYQNYLLTLLAAKDHSLLIVQTELSLFKEEAHRINAPTLERNSEIKTMNLRLNKSEDIISSQALHIKILESEKKELTNIGMEMHTLLSSLFESHLKSTEKLNTINGKLVDSENTVAALTQEFNTKSILKESKLLDEINSLQYELDKQTNSLIAAENEISLSKETLRKIDSEETESFLWGIKLSSELEIANQTCEMYKQAMGVILKSNGEYLDHIDTLKCNIINLKDNVSELEGEKEESKNKLNIITKLFKKQEKEYQKSEIQSLKTEIIDQEANFENKKSATDKIVSNYWISYRQGKRKLKEMELETARLRYKITMDKKFENCTKSMDRSTILDTLLPILSPDFILLDFEPPPPIDSSDFTLLDFEPLPPTDSSDFTLLDFELPPPICSSSIHIMHQMTNLYRLLVFGSNLKVHQPTPLTRRHNQSILFTPPPSSQRSSVLSQRYTYMGYMNCQNSLGHLIKLLNKKLILYTLCNHYVL